MKVILLDNVKKVGRKFDAVDVANGYGMNFLIPRGLARVATPEAEQVIAKERAKHRALEAAHHELLAQSLSELKNTRVEISAPANEQGHLFAGIHQKEIAEAIERVARIALPHDAIILSEPIKEVGEHVVHLAIGEEKGVVTVVVLAEA